MDKLKAEAEIVVELPLEFYRNLHDDLVIKWKDHGQEHIAVLKVKEWIVKPPKKE